MLHDAGDRERELPCIEHATRHVFRDECWSEMMRWRLHHGSPLHSGENWVAYEKAVTEKIVDGTADTQDMAQKTEMFQRLLDHDHNKFKQEGQIFYDDTTGNFLVPLENAAGEKFSFLLSLEEVSKFLGRLSDLVRRSVEDNEENKKRNAGLLEGVSNQELEGEIYGR